MFIEFIKFLAKFEWESCNMWKALKVERIHWIENWIKFQGKSLLNCRKNLFQQHRKQNKMIFLLSEPEQKLEQKQQMIVMFMGEEISSHCFQIYWMFFTDEKSLIDGSICKSIACCYPTDCRFVFIFYSSCLKTSKINLKSKFDKISSRFVPGFCAIG